MTAWNTRTPSSPPAQAAPVSGEVTPWDVAQAERHYPPDCWRREAITDLAQFVSEVRRAALATPPASASQVEAGSRLRVAARQAHDALIELNPNNYSHDDVCKANDAAVEAILLLADALGETHGKTPDWWEARRAAFQAERPTPILEK